VVYEMATGKKVFEGQSRASVIAAIMHVQLVPINTLAQMSPPVLDRTVNQCLAKDPDERWQSAQDLKSELQWIKDAGSRAGVPAPVVAHRRKRERLAWTVAALAVLLVFAGGAAGFFCSASGHPRCSPSVSPCPRPRKRPSVTQWRCPQRAPVWL
jgi:eukaryotic-like serine/threonine-protein kinase